MVRLLREYVKEALFGGVLPVLIPEPPPPEERLQELPRVMQQYNDRVTPPELAGPLDEDLAGLFDAVLMMSGYPSDKSMITDIKNRIKPIISYHKLYFDAPRPAEVAESAGIDFRPEKLDSAQTKSYPSGHAAQAFYIADVLSEKYPEVSDLFYQLAEMVAQSRIDRGVHFQSDLDGGRMLAQRLHQGKT